MEEVRWREAGEEAAAAFARTGCSGTLPQNGPVLVEAKLNFQTSPGIRTQFQRELRLGEIVEREDGAYYRALINDPLELFPFLRSFSPWLRILPGEHGLDRRLREDLLQMLGEEGDHETAE